MICASAVGMTACAGWIVYMAAAPVMERSRLDAVRNQALGRPETGLLERLKSVHLEDVFHDALRDANSSSFPDDSSFKSRNAVNQELPADQDPWMKRKIDFRALQKINPDCKAWLFVPDTGIDAYVMQEPEEGQSRYIDHSIDGKNQESGSFFKMKMPDGYDNAVDIIYGHRMTSQFGEWMFSNMPFYYSEKGQGHDLIYVYTEKGTERWRLWSAADLEENDDLYAVPYTRGSGRYKKLLETYQKKAFYTLFDIDADQDVLVLSTCTRLANGNPGRFTAVFVRDAYTGTEGEESGNGADTNTMPDLG